MHSNPVNDLFKVFSILFKVLWPYCGKLLNNSKFLARSYPFNLRFVSDDSEGEFEHIKDAPNNRGELKLWIKYYGLLNKRTIPNNLYPGTYSGYHLRMDKAYFI